MAIQYVRNAQQTLPAAAAGASCVSTGASWTNGAWVEITASAADAGILTGVVFNTTENNPTHFEIDIGKGGAGAEVVIATLRGYSYNIIGVNDNGQYFPLPVGIGGWAVGERLAARVRISRAAVSTWTIALTYYPSPISGSYQTTTQAPQVLPAASVITLPTGGSAWVNGAYQEYSASLPNDIIVIGLVTPPTAQNGPYQVELDIAQGGAGAEVVKHQFKFMVNGWASMPWYTCLNTPLFLAGGSRLAVRARDDQNFPYNNQTYAVSLVYLDLPL